MEQFCKETLLFIKCLPWAVITGIAAGIICYYVSSKNKKTAILYGTFFAYLTFLLNRVWFSRLGREIHGFFPMPFSTLSDKAHIIRFVLNIIMFIPIGVFLTLMFPAIYEKGIWKTAVTGLLLSLIIEVVQGMLMLGNVQIDDIIANTCGAAVGWIFVMIICP